MSETLLQFPATVIGPDGTAYEARACGGPRAGGIWHGWIEFIPLGAGKPVRSPLETTQPNRTNIMYWASGLTPICLEGALRRALSPRLAVPVMPPQPSVFSDPAPRLSRPAAVEPRRVLDPFSLYRKGEALLRKELGAMAGWHLVNIARAYKLTDADAITLNQLPSAELIERIVAGVRARLPLRRRYAR